MRHRATTRGSEAAERVRRLLVGRGNEGVGTAAPSSYRVGARAAWADPGRRKIATTVVVALAAALLAGGWVLASKPRADPGPPIASATSASLSPAGAARASPAHSSDAPLIVDVAGKVRHPGLYRLTRGARVDDALRAAGGALPGVDLSTLNRAAPVADGQQVLVGAAVPVPQRSGSLAPGGSGVAAGAPVALNAATVEQLQALPGVGPVLAQHIVDWRTQHGRFATIDQLKSVSGIGPAKFAGIKDLVTL